MHSSNSLKETSLLFEIYAKIPCVCALLYRSNSVQHATSKTSITHTQLFSYTKLHCDSMQLWKNIAELVQDIATPAMQSTGPVQIPSAC